MEDLARGRTREHDTSGNPQGEEQADSDTSTENTPASIYSGGIHTDNVEGGPDDEDPFGYIPEM
eukprot:10823550-Prorocentrum_lima.AAC.1